jgi:hypothetical protein
MPDPELAAAALEALETVLIVIIEDAHEVAVASAPETVDAHGERVQALRRVGTDLVVLAEACAVLLRSAEEAPSAQNLTS